MKRANLHIVVMMTLLYAIFACGGGGGGGNGDDDPDSQISVSGNVKESILLMGTMSTNPSDGVTIRVSSDLNQNGSIDTGESETTTTNSNGDYSVEAPAAVGTTTVVSFAKEGYATVIRTVKVQSLGNAVMIGCTLKQLYELEASGDGWQDQGNTVGVSGINISSGYARAFNPVTETSQFPGSFSDDQGNMLISGVFAEFDLKDESGNPIRALSGGQTATIRMQVPKSTWGVIKDETAGNSQIDVPMYYFNEDTGQWSSSGNGWLVDADGIAIDEGQLAAITGKTYSGKIYAASEASHFSYWNVDWPIDSHACITGVIVDDQGAPVSGAVVHVQGITYTGVSTPTATDAEGRFCIDVMRNEDAGEDLDGDGNAGETQQLLITVFTDDTYYRFNPIPLADGTGTCPSGCMEMGLLPLSAAGELQIQSCNISGTVWEPDGVTGATDVMVFGTDEIADHQALMDACPGTPGSCLFTTTDGSGEFDFSPVYLSSLRLMATKMEEIGDIYYTYYAQNEFVTCPTGDVDLQLELLSCFKTENTLSESGGVISWTGTADILGVSSSSGDLKWMVISLGGFGSPLTYGTVPGGAEQYFPESGSPEALEAGDMIYLISRFTDADSNTCINYQTDFVDP
ncbi:MAG: carboxypeptidase regulatory-like domain-containing protein [Desulfobacteraceae bacterium]|nr:carboxypeptidase regulatory-like domain-containing protein [Desulfobacteraceae bacterium]